MKWESSFDVAKPGVGADERHRRMDVRDQQAPGRPHDPRQLAHGGIDVREMVEEQRAHGRVEGAGRERQRGRGPECERDVGSLPRRGGEHLARLDRARSPRGRGRRGAPCAGRCRTRHRAPSTRPATRRRSRARRALRARSTDCPACRTPAPTWRSRTRRRARRRRRPPGRRRDPAGGAGRARRCTRRAGRRWWSSRCEALRGRGARARSANVCRACVERTTARSAVIGDFGDRRGRGGGRGCPTSGSVSAEREVQLCAPDVITDAGSHGHSYVASCRTPAGARRPVTRNDCT